MRFSEALANALVQNKHITTEGRVVGTIILGVVGVSSVGISWIGWRHAQGIVPSSLPDNLYWKRFKVIRRGAVTFAIIGVLFLAMAVWVAATA